MSTFLCACAILRLSLQLAFSVLEKLYSAQGITLCLLPCANTVTLEYITVSYRASTISSSVVVTLVKETCFYVHVL